MYEYIRKEPNIQHFSTGAAKSKAHSSSSVARVLCFGAGIVLLLVAMIIILLSYLCFAHECHMSGKTALISTAALGKTLTISQVASHVAPITVPLVMGLCSYHVGARWMDSSTTGGPNRPSPLQLGLLLQILSSANIAALFSSMKSIHSARSKSRLSTPPMLRHSMMLLFIFLCTSYVISAADAWLHASSKAITLESTTAYIGSSPELFGRAMNTTRCDRSRYTSALTQNTCGLLSGGSGGDGRARMEGLRTISNSSSMNRVMYADDRTAILVPQSLPSNITYTATTLGVKASCRSITRECLAPVPSVNDSLDYGPNARLKLDCQGEAVFNATDVSGQEALDVQGNGISGYEISSNPFFAGAVITSQAYLDAEDEFYPNTGWFVHGNNGAWNVVYCNVSTLNVLYRHSSPDIFTVIQSSPTDLETAQYMVTFGFETPSTWVADRVDGAGLVTDPNTNSTGDTYEEAYSLELGRQVLARGAVIYQSAPTSEISSKNIVIGSRLRMAPLVLMIAAMVTYICFVLFILIQALASVLNAPLVRLASLYVNDPLTIIHTLYGKGDASSTWEYETKKRFGEESEQDRLAVGEMYGERFGVMKAGQR
ncbi:hypothetical protein BDQ12DRAFT_722828 [Crucibulum laeve]|uniref:Uncharacterized protein n=1 Tax=Crucibulum laeve TaxID=68775 RepID=A0A5C3M459_9AGAR|nr:hypothetical protein BDQ12DRAFT_722828 [Crucibulum laeve]